MIRAKDNFLFHLILLSRSSSAFRWRSNSIWSSFGPLKLTLSFRAFCLYAFTTVNLRVKQQYTTVHPKLRKPDDMRFGQSPFVCVITVDTAIINRIAQWVKSN